MTTSPLTIDSMKRIYTLTYAAILSIILTTPLFAQQTITANITHQGLQRTYILYVPAIYDTATAVPLLLNFHGYGSQAVEQLFYGDFRPIADTANFLVVHPLGTNDNTGTAHWNVGWGGSTVDDVSFTNALIDTLAANYAIDETRVYSTGMSNGGFFSYKLACDLSQRIAAVASVTGSMTLGQVTTCNASHQMPTMQIHGTADPTVPYGGSGQMQAIEDVVNYWVNTNNCDATPSMTNVPDINTSDNSTVEHYVYNNGDNGATVELFKVIGGGHTWPGSSFLFSVTNLDINASQEIWRFFSKYDINGIRTTTSTSNEDLIEKTRVYPNPTYDWIVLDAPINTAYTLSSTDGKILLQGKTQSNQQQLNLTPFPTGLYWLKVNTQTTKVLKLK